MEAPHVRKSQKIQPASIPAAVRKPKRKRLSLSVRHRHRRSNGPAQKKGRIETEPPSPKIVEAPHHYPNRNQAEPSMIHALFSLPSD